MGDNYRVYVWKRKGEGSRPDLYGEQNNSVKSRFKVMVWGCNTCYGIGTLSFVDGNIDAEKYLDTLEENLWPVIARQFPTDGEIFQDDGAPVHTANIVKTWKRNNGINTLPCPPPPPPTTAQTFTPLKIVGQLSRKIYSSMFCRLSLAISYIKQLYLSIPRRIRQVQVFKGHRTQY